MKKKAFIILSILLLIFLIVRPVYNYLKKLNTDKKWYVEKLHFDFSGAIDSIHVLAEGAGFVQFHLTRGDVNKSREDSLNNTLGRPGSIRLLVFKNDGIEIFTHMPASYSPGDSICINTDKGTVVVYRRGQEISNDEVAMHLQQAAAISLDN